MNDRFDFDFKCNNYSCMLHAYKRLPVSIPDVVGDEVMGNNLIL